VEPVKSLTNNKDLISYMIKAELKSKHFRKLLGPLWWLFEPLAMAMTYYFLTIIVFHSSSGPNQFLFILVAVIAWRWFSKSIDESPLLLGSYASIIGRTNFPLLPLLYIYSGLQLVYFAAGIVVVFAFLAAYGIQLTYTIAFLPFVMLVQGTFIIGLSSILARVGVYIKDLGSAVWIFTSIWFYLSPGIYSESLVPQQLRVLYELNPWATIFPAYRAILIDGTAPDFTKLAIWLVIFSVMMIVGLRILSRNRGRIYKEL
jgi:lipopolysaccharide transport system permease protein